ncbi:hypothetical protein BST61_g2308 [Cercospora zeina]
MADGIILWLFDIKTLCHASSRSKLLCAAALLYRAYRLAEIANPRAMVHSASTAEVDNHQAAGEECFLRESVQYVYRVGEIAAKHIVHLTVADLEHRRSAFQQDALRK